MSKPAILAIGPLFQTSIWEAFGEYAVLERYPTGTRSAFIEKLEHGDFGNVFAIFRSIASTEITGVFDQEIIPKLPSSLKFITQNGVGYDNIDVDACTERGIRVSYTPHANDNAVADTAIFLMIGALRRIHNAYTSIKLGHWRGADMEFGYDPEGKLLGIVGMGSIGRAIARRAKAFGMRVQYHNRHRMPADAEDGAAFVDLDTLLATSDVISLSLVYTPETHHFLGSEEFAKMKKGVTIVNTARGKMIDEKALLSALDSGIVWSAGLDVFEQEPSTNKVLLEDKRVFLTPHIAAGTKDTYAYMEGIAFDNMRAALTQGTLISPVPEQKDLVFA